MIHRNSNLAKEIVPEADVTGFVKDLLTGNILSLLYTQDKIRCFFVKSVCYLRGRIDCLYHFTGRFQSGTEQADTGISGERLRCCFRYPLTE
jgi:hypothetical protein